MLNFARAHGIGNDSGTGGQPHDYNEQSRTTDTKGHCGLLP